MSGWKDQSIIGIIAGAVAAVSLGLVLFNMAKDAATFRKRPSQELIARPADLQRARTP